MPNNSNKVIAMAVTQAYKGMFVADAAAMPVHWYYNVPAIKEHYKGWISRYEQPRDDHPTSILRISNTGGSGRRGGDSPPPVIGHVILHDKLSAWTEESKRAHYHQGMQAGDNTLNCHCALQAIKTLHSCDASLSDEEVLKRIFVDYVTFMTTPGSHNDTYAESWHRKFFADWVIAGKPNEPDALFGFATIRSNRLQAEPPDKQLECIGSFVFVIPLILHNINRPVEEIMRIAKELYSRTHPGVEIVEPINSFIKILHSVVRGASLKDEAEKALIEHLGTSGKAMLKKFDKIIENSSDTLSGFQKVSEQLGIACYIQGAYSVLLLIARYFYDDFEGGMLTNVNVGGENCHRGAVLGALLGASTGAVGKTIPSKWTEGLTLNAILDEVLNLPVGTHL